MRLEMEPDGTPCKPAPRRRGYCYEGRCRKKHPKTKPPHGPGTSTTGQDHFVPPLNCSKKKRKKNGAACEQGTRSLHSLAFYLFRDTCKMKTWWTFPRFASALRCCGQLRNNVESHHVQDDPGTLTAKKVLSSRPLSPRVRVKCTYVCKGSPVRIGYEPDGTPCDRRGKKRAPGLCLIGKCVRPEEYTASSTFNASKFAYSGS
ncbi:hypothetical protein MTO96_017877 [Rhipicephalus appendiculatus]